MTWEAAQFALLWILGWHWVGVQSKQAGSPFTPEQHLASLFFWPLALILSCFLSLWRFNRKAKP